MTSSCQIPPSALGRKLTWLLACAALSASSMFVRGAEQGDANGREFFEKKIRPVLVKHCYECHSAKSEELGGGLSLDTRDGMRKGGKTGPAVAPKNLRGSLLIAAIEYKDMEMPPEGKLPEEVIADFRKWVQMGAPDPRGAAAASATPAGLKARPAEELWSLRPIVEPQPPEINNADWPWTPIDHFILARLEEHKLTPAADADPLTLLRRLSFDLVGLPPSPDDIERFQQDHSPAAYAALVDRLLDSPQFGERWARHWLDVARFAESNGRDRDVLMPDAWRYRRYAIDAFNQDLPYDRFITEQVAGDLLPAEGSQRDRLTIATGLLAVGSKSLTGGELQMDLIDDQIDVVTRAFLGLTVSCARCHDHKFDPIPTRDYYALAGIFLSTDTRFGGGLRRAKGLQGKLQTLLPLGQNAKQRVADLNERQKSIDTLEKRRKQLAGRLQQLQKKVPKTKDGAQAPDGGKRKRPETKPTGEEKQLADYADAQQRLRETEAELKRLKDEPAPELEFAIGVREAGKISDSRIHIRGERNKLGDVAPRDFLSCVKLSDAPQIDRKQSGRLQLAEWLTHPQNPLTARVAVNRIWTHLLGRGLVATVDNFGFNGAQPTHRGLLDFLAWRFMRDGWSTKRTIREIVLSRTYQLSGALDSADLAIDPDNEFYWRARRRRLEAECLRDAMLSASGELNLAPPATSPVARIGDGEVGRGINTKPLEEPFPRRSVYLPIIRGLVPEVLKVFDFPEPSNVQGLRAVTNVPTQSLFLMNSPFVLRQSEVMAQRVLSQGKDEPSRLALAYELCLGRFPTTDEAARGGAFLRRCEAALADKQSDEPQRLQECWATLCQALFASAEFRHIE